MGIYELDVVGVSVLPAKDHTPLVIDPYQRNSSSLFAVRPVDCLAVREDFRGLPRRAYRVAFAAPIRNNSGGNPGTDFERR